MFGETEGISCPANCCDVCQMKVATLHERKEELSILIQAIDELGKMGEVKVTEWVQGGQIAWMESIQKRNESAHGKSPPNQNGGGHSSASVLLLGIYLVLSSLLHMKKQYRDRMPAYNQQKRGEVWRI